MKNEKLIDGRWITVHGHHVYLLSKVPLKSEHKLGTRDASEAENASTKSKNKNELHSAIKEKLERKALNIKGINFLEITDQYKEKAHPGYGRVKRQSSVKMRIDDYSREEVKEAHWLVDNFGGDVLILRENQDSKYYKYPKGAMMPDLMWDFNGKKYWDIKYPDSYPGTGNLYRHGFKQISINYGPAKNSPGGLIIRITDPSVKIETVKQKLADVFRNSRLEKADVIIKKNDTDYKVFQLWKKKKSNAR